MTRYFHVLDLRDVRADAIVKAVTARIRMSSPAMTGINMDELATRWAKTAARGVVFLWTRCDEGPTVMDCSPVTGEREVVSDLREGSKRFHH